RRSRSARPRDRRVARRSRRPARGAGRLHAPADAGVPGAVPGPRGQRAPLAAPLVSGIAPDRGRARRRGRDDGGDRPPGRRGRRLGAGAAPGAGPGRAARDADRPDPGGRAPPLAPGGPGAMRALISVWDKSGLDDFAAGLHELGVELVASGGTAAYLEERGLPVTRVEALTGFGEMLGHRVVTLHPAVHAGILARRDVEGDLADLERHGIEPFDLVVVNLYPFAEVAAQPGVAAAEAVEMIDIGGPTLLRAAAKNFAWVAPVCRPERYPEVLAEIRSGGLSAETRRRLAAETFAATAAYESAIAGWFAVEDFPATLVPAFVKELDLAYGENPHQRAAYYREASARSHLLSGVEQLGGRELSYNNLNDLAGACRLAADLDG